MDKRRKTAIYKLIGILIVFGVLFVFTKILPIQSFFSGIDGTVKKVEDKYTPVFKDYAQNEDDVFGKDEDIDLSSDARALSALKSIPDYTGQDVIPVNDNKPFFTPKEYNSPSFEHYEKLDSLGRCGLCRALVSKYSLPKTERGEIGYIKPTGWQQAKYEGYINSNPPYLYNRCHLIGWQLTGCNDKSNLITGTRYFNAELMLPYENAVATLAKKGKKILYRVIPYFKNNELLARGILLEAYCIGNPKKSFCVFIYNVQPGITIDYQSGLSTLTTK